MDDGFKAILSLEAQLHWPTVGLSSSGLRAVSVAVILGAFLILKSTIMLVSTPPTPKKRKTEKIYTTDFHLPIKVNVVVNYVHDYTVRIPNENLYTRLSLGVVL